MILSPSQADQHTSFLNTVKKVNSRELLATIGIFASLLAVFSLTAPRTIALEDDGFFVLASYYFGVAHPPGYPLHTLLGKLFTYLPIGTVAFRVHLMSAFFGALAGVMLYKVVQKITGSQIAAVIGALCFGLSPVFWSQSIIAEVYTLNAFLFFVVLFFIVKVHPMLAGGTTLSSRTIFNNLLFAAFVYGLSLANHWPLIGLSTPGLFVLLWPLRYHVFKKFHFLVLAGLLGLIPYLWLVIRSQMNPVISFCGPITSWHEFWSMVTRSGYASVDTSVTAGLSDKLQFMQFFVKEIGRQFLVVGVVLVVIGFVVQWRKLPKSLSVGLTVIAFCNSILLILMLNFDFEYLQRYVFRVYPILTYAVMSIWLALGAMDSIKMISRRLDARWGWTALAGVTIIPVFLHGFGELDRHDYHWSRDYARNVLLSLPKNSVLFVDGDVEVGTLSYFHYIDHLRPDVTLMNSSGLLLNTRLFPPLKTSQAEAKKYVSQFVKTSNAIISSVRDLPAGKHGVDHWLYTTLDKNPHGAKGELSDAQIQFFLSDVFDSHATDPWTVFFQNLLKRRFAAVYAVTKKPGAPDRGKEGNKLPELFQSDFYTSLGYVEGMFANHNDYNLQTVGRYLEYAQNLYPKIGQKTDMAKFYELLGYYYFETRHIRKAITSLNRSVDIWPTRNNSSVKYLLKYYKTNGQHKYYESLARRVGIESPGG